MAGWCGSVHAEELLSPSFFCLNLFSSFSPRSHGLQQR